MLLSVQFFGPFLYLFFSSFFLFNERQHHGEAENSLVLQEPLNPVKYSPNVLPSV